MTKTMINAEIAHDKPATGGYFYSYINLPAEGYQILDAMQQARIISASGEYPDISIVGNAVGFDLSDMRLDNPTIDELNFLAKRLEAMGETDLRKYGAVVQTHIRKDDIVTMKDLINCSYGLDEVMVASNVSNDEQLGQFVIDNELQEDIASIPESSLYLLDKKLIGRMYREALGTVYTGNLCVFPLDYTIPNVYDGEHLPEGEASSWFAFRLLVDKAPKTETDEVNAEWISLPIDKNEANRIASLHGESCIENCVYYSFESSVPQIDSEMFGSMQDFNKLNQLSAMMAEMSPIDQIKFKAVLVAEKPLDVDGILDIASNLHFYEMDTAVDNDDDFFKSYLAHHLDSKFDTEWLDTIMARIESGRLLDRLGATVTDYGVISSRGESLYRLVPYFEIDKAELKTQALTDEKLDVIEVLDRVALFSNGRILPEEVPAGLYAYDIKTDDDGEFFRSVEKEVLVNYGGTILLKEPLEFGDTDCIVMDDDSSPNFLGYDLTPTEFMQTDFTEAEDEAEQAEDDSEETEGQKMVGI